MFCTTNQPCLGSISRYLLPSFSNSKNKHLIDQYNHPKVFFFKLCSPCPTDINKNTNSSLYLKTLSVTLSYWSNFHCLQLTHSHSSQLDSPTPLCAVAHVVILSKNTFLPPPFLILPTLQKQGHSISSRNS